MGDSGSLCDFYTFSLASMGSFLEVVGGKESLVFRW